MDRTEFTADAHLVRFKIKSEKKMATLQAIREKLRSLPFDSAGTPSFGCTSPVMPSSASNGYGLSIVIGLVIGVIVTVVVVKMWMSYRGDVKAKEPTLPPADQYVAQLAERIKNAPAVPRVAPVHPPMAPPTAQPMYRDTDQIGEWPKPEYGGQPSAAPIQMQQMQEPMSPPPPGLDTSDPYLTPL